MSLEIKKHLTYFANSTEIGSGYDVDLPNVSYLEGKNVLYFPGENSTVTININSTTGEIEEAPNYANMYLTFEIIESGTFYFNSTLDTDVTVQYSLNNGADWTTLAKSTQTPTFNVGDKILWKCNRVNVSSTFQKYINFVSSNGTKYKVYGNVMSILYGDNFIGQTDLTGKDYVFKSLFNANFGLVDVSNLALPATILSSNCYNSMFNNCQNLTTAPTLPATTLATACYNSMFYNCQNLTTAPALPAMLLVDYCYTNMFYGCYKLVAAPALPATTLANSCYSGMFYNCSSLTTAPTILPATILTNFCYRQMFYNCKALTTAPELPAATLVQQCYENMFYNCNKLNYIKMLATDVSASNCLYLWVAGVAATGTFVKATSMTELPSDNNGIPSGWTVQDVSS